MSSPASSNSDQDKEEQPDCENDETSAKAENKGLSNEGASKNQEVQRKQILEKKENENKDDEDDDDDDDQSDETEVGLLDRPVVMSGARDRKKVQRLELTFSIASKEKPEIPEGTGEKLGECPRIEYQIQKNSIEELKFLHRVLFARPGSGAQLKKNIKKFNGFTFKKDSSEYQKKKATLDKMTTANLKHICEILDIERSGTKEDIVLRVLEFLLQPKASGKAIPKPKRKIGGKGGKRKQSKSNGGGKKKLGKKTKDSDEDEDIEDNSDSDQDEPKKKKAKLSSKKGNEKNISSKKRAKKGSTQTPTKKADDSSDERSSDDEPLVKISKSPPTNDEIKAYVKKVLKAADLQTVTMKTVIQQVYEHYPDFDLASRKDFIKATVKSVIS